MKIIDARVRLRTEQLLKVWTSDQTSYYKDYVRLYKMKSRLSAMPVDEMLSLAAQRGVERMMVYGITAADNDHILELSRGSDAIIPVAGVTIENGIRFAMRDIKKYHDHGAAAAFLSPFTMKFNLNDRLLYPLYGLCELLKMPMIVHGAIHFWRGAYMWQGQPQFIDEIAVDFPELKLIVSHGGNGFGPPILAVAQRHPNVFLEFSALNPAYMAPEFLYAANTYLRQKCIFGTDYPLVDFEPAIGRWKKVLREEVWERFFYLNVLDALQGDPVPY